MKGQRFSDFNLPDRVITPPKAVDQENLDSYISNCDKTTLYYDAFLLGDCFIVIAPPLDLKDIIFLYDAFFFNDEEKAQVYVSNNKSEFLTTEAYTRIITKLELKNSVNNSSTQTANLIGLLREERHKNIAYTLQKNNTLDWIVDWARWCVDECGSDLVVIYDNGSTDYDSREIEMALIENSIVGFVMDVPYKYGPAWVPSNPWGSKHLWLQRACLEHIRCLCKFSSNESNKEVIVLNTDIDELLHTPKGECNIYETLKDNGIDVAHFMRLPVYLEKGTFDIENIKHKDHNLVKKALKPQAPKNIFNATKLDLNARMHQHIINSGSTKAVQFLNIFASHCIGINNGWKFQSDEMKYGWPSSPAFLSYDVCNALEIVTDFVDLKNDIYAAWIMNDEKVHCLNYPHKKEEFS